MYVSETNTIEMTNDTLQVNLKMKEIHANVCNVTDNLNVAWVYQGYSKTNCVHKSTTHLPREEPCDCCLSISFQMCWNRKHVCDQNILCSIKITFSSRLSNLGKEQFFTWVWKTDGYGKHYNAHTHINWKLMSPNIIVKLNGALLY